MFICAAYGLDVHWSRMRTGSTGTAAASLSESRAGGRCGREDCSGRPEMGDLEGAAGGDVGSATRDERLVQLQRVGVCITVGGGWPVDQLPASAASTSLWQVQGQEA
jgi:hypothetical protein